MKLNTIVQNSNGKFLVRTVPTSLIIEFGTGFETQVHPVIDGEPNIYKFVDYKYSTERVLAAEAHQNLVDKWSKI